MVSEAAHRCDVGLNGRIVVHAAIHCRCQKDGALCCEDQGSERVASIAVSNIGKCVGGAGCYDHRVGPFGPVDVPRPSLCHFLAVGEPSEGHLIARECRHRVDPDESSCRLRHGHTDHSPLFLQEPEEYGGLIGCNAPGNSKQYVLAGEPHGRSYRAMSSAERK